MIIFWSLLPILELMIYLIYQRMTGGSIDMDSTTIAALIAAVVSLIGVFVTLLRNNKQDKARYELLQKENEILKSSVNARHTLEKAHEYHELTMKELEKEFQYNKERITDVKGGISGISSAVGGVSRDIKLMSKDLENHVLNLKEVVYKEPDLVGALKIFEGYIQKLGEVQRENERLHKKNQELLIELEHQNEKNKELTLQINTFHHKICDIEKEAQLLKADKSQQNEYIELLRQENQKLKRLKKKDHSKDDLSL